MGNNFQDAKTGQAAPGLGQSTARRLPRILGCVWFALLMGTPYAPLDGSAFNIPFGASSLSKTYTWVALGLLVGMWVATHPYALRASGRFPRLARGIAAVGGALCAVVALSGWINAAMLLDIPDGAVEWSVYSLSGWMGPLVPAFRFVLVHISAFAFASALMCSGYLRHVLCSADSSGNHTGRRLSPILLSGALGVLQPLAWVLALPHSDFPLPLVGFDTVSPEDVWHLSAVSTLPGMLVPTLAMAAFALAASHRPQGHDAVGPFAGLCAGILLFRVASRVAPSLFETPYPVAAASSAVYVLLFAGYIASLYPAKTEAGDGSCAHIPESPTSVLSDQGLAYLKAKKLSSREILVLCTQIAGLTAKQASPVLGIGESTVREYRRRCRVKLGLSGADAIETALPDGSLSRAAPKTGNSQTERPEPAPPLRKAIAVVGACGLTASAALVLLPFPGDVRSWSDVWTTCFGIGIGLSTLQVLALASPGRTRGTASKTWKSVFSAAILAAGIVLSATGIAVHRISGEPASDFVAAHNAFVVCAAALFTVCAALGFRRCTAAGGGVDAIRNTPWPVLALCAAVLCGSAGTLWWGVALFAAVACIVPAVFAAVSCEQAFVDGEQRRRAKALDPSLLAACALFGWMWAEVWRSQLYVSLLAPLACGVALLLVIETYRTGLHRRENRHLLAALLAAALATLVTRGYGSALVVYGFLLTLTVHERPSGKAGEYPEPSWHSARVALSLGLLGGTLATNAYGYQLLGTNSGLGLDSEAMGVASYCAIAALCLLVIATRCLAALRAPAVGLAFITRTQAESALLRLGLRQDQTTVAVLLAEGRSVREIAEKIGCTQSEARKNRDEIYDRLGVTSRAQLADTLKQQVNGVDA